MKKKLSAILLYILLAFSLFSACSKNKEIDLPIAPKNELITKPQGEFFETNGKAVAQGGLSALGDGYIKIMVEDTEYKFEMSANVMNKVNIFNKDKKNLKIMRGTFLMLYYEVQDGKYFATDIEIINAN